MENVANFTQFIEEDSEFQMDNELFKTVQEFYDEGKLEGLANYIKYSDTWPREVICGEYRRAHGKENAEKLFQIEFFN